MQHKNSAPDPLTGLKTCRGLQAGAPTGVRRKSATRNVNLRMPSLLAITAESEMAMVRPRYLHPPEPPHQTLALPWPGSAA